jgi:hypothetical protein
MMLRGNLATRPFYNERLVSFALVVLLLVVVALTALNVTRLTELSSRRSALRSQIDLDEAQATRIRQGALAQQSSVDRSALVNLAGSTRLANTLISARTFSWTTFFGYIEDTIPFDVRITAVSPVVDDEDGDIALTLLLVGRSESDIDTFGKRLEETGAFYDVMFTVANSMEDGLKQVTLTAMYLPPKIASPPAPSAETGGRQ